MTKAKEEYIPKELTLTKEQQEQMAAKLKWRIARDYPFFSQVVRNTVMEFEQKPQITFGTVAATNGKRIFLNQNFADMDYNQQIGIILHELLHILWLHPIRWNMITDNKYQMVYNVIADCRINEELLRKSNLKLEGAVYPNNIVDILQKIGFREKKGYDMENEIAKIVSEDTEKYSSDEAYNYVKNFIEYDETKVEIVIMPRGSGDLTKPQEGGKELTPKQVEELEKRIKSDIIQGIIEEKIRGTGKGNYSNSFEELLAKHEVNWKIIVKNHIRAILRGKRTWNKLHKKSFLEYGNIIPGFKKKEKIIIAVGIDVSGSIDDNEYKKFCGELLTVCKDYRAQLKVAQFDDGIQNEFEIKTKKDLGLFKKRNGYGGTSFRHFLDKYGEEKLKVIFTDGYGDQNNDNFITKYKQYSKGLIWITTAEQNFPFGKVVKINDR